MQPRRTALHQPRAKLRDDFRAELANAVRVIGIGLHALCDHLGPLLYVPVAPLDLAGLALAVVAGVALIRFKQGVIPVILACALAGWALKSLGWAA